MGSMALSWQELLDGGTQLFEGRELVRHVVPSALEKTQEPRLDTRLRGFHLLSAGSLLNVVSGVALAAQAEQIGRVVVQAPFPRLDVGELGRVE